MFLLYPITSVVLLTEIVASVVVTPALIAALTNAVVAIWVLLDEEAGVGLVGVPVKLGDARLALLSTSGSWSVYVSPDGNLIWLIFGIAITPYSN